VREAVRDVYRAEVPHYFKYVVSNGAEGTQPKLEHVADEGTAHPRFVVSVPAGTGDWFGGWTGDVPCEGQRYCNADATGGRLVELIERGEPAVMLCHWPGLYNNGTRQGFAQFKGVIRALDGRFRERTIWMKISELARYWAARRLTRIVRAGAHVALTAPVACPRFTLRVPVAKQQAAPRLAQQDRQIPLAEVRQPADLKPGTWLREADALTVCFDLPQGEVTMSLGESGK
jgi:hypothetical protein